MSTATTCYISAVEFCTRFQRTAELYLKKLDGSVISVTDAAVAAIQEAQLPLFGTHLEVVSCIKQYIAVTDQEKSKILYTAYKQHNQLVAE